MSKTVLSFEIELDVDLFCIISSVRDYRLCWMINKILNFNFIRQADIEINNQKKRTLSYFNLYLHEDELDRSKYYIVANKSLGEFLIPELKQVDYFMMVDDQSGSLDKNELLSLMKNIAAIEAVFETNANNLKSKQNLILE